MREEGGGEGELIDNDVVVVKVVVGGRWGRRGVEGVRRGWHGNGG